MKIREAVDLRMPGMVVGRVVAQQHHLDRAQGHDPVGLRPAAVVADAHSKVAAHGLPDRKPEVAGLEVAFFEMLEGALRPVVGMARQVDFSILADDGAAVVHQHRGVEALQAGVGLGEFGVAEVEPDAQFGGGLEQDAGLGARHLALKEDVDLLVGLEPPAGEEGGEGKLREHHQLRAAGGGLAHHLQQAGHAVGPGLRQRDRAHLGGGDHDGAGAGVEGGGHQAAPLRARSVAAASTAWPAMTTP